MVEDSGGTGFLQESCPLGFVGNETGGKKLQGGRWDGSPHWNAGDNLSL
jgi:hypothetical protein